MSDENEISKRVEHSLYNGWVARPQDYTFWSSAFEPKSPEAPSSSASATEEKHKPAAGPSNDL